jgi:hypothetical protein
MLVNGVLVAGNVVPMAEAGITIRVSVELG